MAREASNANMASILLSAIMSSWYAKITLLVLFAAGAGAVYWYRDSLSLTVGSIEESIISRLGLGVVAVALWIAVFMLALFVHTSLFRHYRLWLASPVFLASLLGFLSFFAPFQGPLARFTLEGDVTLGGAVGYAIAGEVVWLGVLRVFAVFAVAIAIVSPRVALGALSIAGTGLVGIYLAVMSIGRAIGSKSKSAKSSDEQAAQPGADSHASGRWSESLRRTMEKEEFRERTSSSFSWKPRPERPEPQEIVTEDPEVRSLGSVLNGLSERLSGSRIRDRSKDSAQEHANANVDRIQEVVEEPEPTISSAGTADWHNPASDEMSGGKFNKLWDSQAPVPGNGAAPAPAADEDANGGRGRMMSVVQAVMGASSWARPALSMFVDANEGGRTPSPARPLPCTASSPAGSAGRSRSTSPTQTAGPSWTKREGR